MFNPSFYYLRLQIHQSVQDIAVGTDWTAVPDFAGSAAPGMPLHGRILTDLTDLRAGPDDFGLQYHDGGPEAPDTYLPLCRATPRPQGTAGTAPSWLAAAPLFDPVLSRLCEQMPCTLDYHGTGRIAHVALLPDGMADPCWRVSIECLGHDRYRCAAPWEADGWSFGFAAQSRAEAFFLAASLHPAAAGPDSAFRRLFPEAPPQPASGAEFRQRQPATLEVFFRAHGDMAQPLALLQTAPPTPVSAHSPCVANPAVAPAATAPSRSLQEIIQPLLDRWQFPDGAINLYVQFHAGDHLNRDSVNSVIGKLLKRKLQNNPDSIYPRTWTAVFRQIDIEAMAGVRLTDRAALGRAYAIADRRLLEMRTNYYLYGGQDWNGFFNTYAAERRARLTAE
jgi:hypothetical protein